MVSLTTHSIDVAYLEEKNLHLNKQDPSIDCEDEYMTWEIELSSKTLHLLDIFLVLPKSLLAILF